MDQVTQLIERFFSASHGELHVAATSVGAIAADHGTPLYIYDRHVLDRKWSSLRGALPAEFAVYYSVKANPTRAFLRYFVDKGCGLEVASRGELQRALDAGCPASRVIFAGPGKTEPELEFALANGIGEIHVESPLELERVASISRRLGVTGRVALRVNPSEEVQGGAMRMGGKAAPFGIDEEQLDAVLERALADPAIAFRGIHLYIGTQILDADVLLGLFRHGIKLAKRIAAQLDGPLHTVDFGGGLGIPYFPHEKELDMAAFADGLTELMVEVRSDPVFSETQFIIEPGRFLVGEAGIYVARVNDIKTSRGKKFLVTDGGMHHHLAASGNLGQVIKRNYPTAVLNKLDDTSTETVDVVGPLCTPLDVLARDIALPVAKVGDLIGVFQSGAYARSASPLGFLSHPAPPEVWVESGQAHLIRRRGTLEDASEVQDAPPCGSDDDGEA